MYKRQVATHELASAVSNAGGLGIIGAGGAPASWVKEQICLLYTSIGRADGRAVDTLEGLEEEAKQFTGFFAAQGADPVSYTHLVDEARMRSVIR